MSPKPPREVLGSLTTAVLLIYCARLLAFVESERAGCALQQESTEEEGRGGRRGRRSSGSSVGTSASGGGGRSSSGGGSGSKRCDMRAKLERSRQSARECRARKKLRYQYLEELVADREKAVLVLRHELDMYRQYFKEMDEGNIPEAVLQILEREQEEREQQIAQQE